MNTIIIETTLLFWSSLKNYGYNNFEPWVTAMFQEGKALSPAGQ